MSDVFKWAALGDLQIPYHDKRAVTLAMKALKWWKPDAIDFTGDIDDQLEYSRFSAGYTDEFFNQVEAERKAAEKDRATYDPDLLAAVGEQADIYAPELPTTDPLPFVKSHADAAREFYSDMRKQHKNADIHSSLGNHDIRVFDYIDRKAPEIKDEVTPNFLWGLDDLGITWRLYHEPPLKRFADIHVHHGLTSSDTGMAVKGDIEKLQISLLRGHDHKGGVVHRTFPIVPKTLVGIGAGHLCDPWSYGMQYANNPQWEQGFVIVHVVNDVAFPQFIRIQDYTCVVDGKLFVN